MRPISFVVLAAFTLLGSNRATAQGSADDRAMNMAEHAMGGMMDSIMMKHMILSPARVPTKADSDKALAVVKELRVAIAKYQDTTAAVADGYTMFAPNVKNQRVYHFTKLGNALFEVLRFDPNQPTSLLYERDGTGKLKLVGAMYTMPRRTPLVRLDERIPLGIARWHRHVNWCMPLGNEQSRWNEMKDGMPVFGPESPIATRAECDKVGGQFTPALFGWMVHAHVFKGDDLATIFSDDHGAGHDHH
jgi:hypothetical protein